MNITIETPLFGKVDVEEKEIIQFPNGLPGLHEEKRFVFIPVEKTLFTVMQSVDSPVYFFVMNPFHIFQDYEFKLSDNDNDFLGIEDAREVAVWNIATIKEEFKNSTTNMQAPLVINTKKRLGKQIILDQYQIKQPLFFGENAVKASNE